MRFRNTSTWTNLAAFSLALFALSLVLLEQTPAARADDRQLFGTSSTSPYLFIMLDTTGSMQWLPSADDAFCESEPNIGLGNEDCTAPRIDDDPASRMYRAKEALYDVLEETNGVNWGFSVFPNRSELRVRNIGTSTDPDSPGPFVSSDRGGSSCNLEGNGDTGSDEFSATYNLLQDDYTTASGIPGGDLVPLDWDDTNRLRIQQRLAPNLLSDSTEVPDFGIATYFGTETEPDGFVSVVKLLDPAERPILARSGTPLAGALEDFRTWFDDWETVAAPPAPAIPADPGLADNCREVSAVLVTDGVETCVAGAGSDLRLSAPIDAAHDLWNPGPGQRKIRTYVIGFANTNSSLHDIAAAGGSPIHDCGNKLPNGSPDPSPDPEPDPGCHAYSADDKDQLIAVFNEIVGEVRGSSRTFATASVPSVVGSDANSVYLSSFSPTDPNVDPSLLWPGRLDSYKKPVPLTNVSGQQVPDSSTVCADPDNDDGCLAWRASEKLLEQAPNAVEVDTDLQLGLAANQRRVYWAPEDATRVPEDRQMLGYQTDTDLQDALYGGQGFGITPVPAVGDAGRSGWVDQGEAIIKYFLKEKVAVIPDPITLVPGSVPYVMADIFHSDPVIVGEPNRSDYFAKDLAGEIEPCGTTNTDKGRYPCFVKNQIGRRRVLIAGSNEGALHAFDAGSAVRNADGFLEYTAGTGQELFAYVPRSVMGAIRVMSNGGGQRFTVDGPVTVDDVLRDRYFTGADALNPAQREWSTVAIGGLREGGRSYYALDITQPDAISGTTNLPIRDTRGPGCTDAPTTCDTKYPESMWEFTDNWDEDNNGAQDLGFTWSKPNTGRIRVIDPDDITKTVDMYVAVFGGGLDPVFKNNPVGSSVEGNYLYMVDIETGKMVYKRRLDSTGSGVTTTPSMVPSEPAAVDTDQDSYLDTIYIGTTAGYLYKVDISAPVALEENEEVFNWLENDPVTGVPPKSYFVDRITDEAWDPFPIFNTGGRPIYYPPSVIFVPELARFALAFGTGDREDLWNPRYTTDPLNGRFYVLLDDGLAPDPMDPGALPLDGSDLEDFDATDSSAGSIDADLLASPNSGFQGGFELELINKERLIAKSFGLSGVLFFSTYIPETTPAGVGLSCGSSGKSRLYAVFTTNGVGIDTDQDRFREVDDFVTSPFVETDGGSGDLPTNPVDPSGNSGPCSEDELQAIRSSLMSKMPAECNFAQYSLNVMTLSSGSGLECIVPIPVCVIQRNWKEF